MKKKAISIEILPEQPVYTISVVSDIVHIPVWTLRVLDTENICSPKRTEGKKRLYSYKDLLLLNKVHHLMEDEGVNLNGVRLMLDSLINELEKEV